MDLKRKICTTLTIAALCLLVALPALANGGALTLAEAVEERVALTVTGPADLVYTAVFEAGTTPVFELFDEEGFTHPDGSYTWELRSAPAEATQVRGGDEDRAIAKRARTEALASGYFSIRGGAFVSPSQEEQVPAKIDVPTKDIVHLDDVIIDGSLCVGFDCVNGESFGFDTIRIKENNLRIKAQDTSSTASFPTNDWQLTFNDSSNGGAEKFSIDDIDNGRTPFTIEASAPSHSLYVDDGGRIGFGTSTPVVDLHVKSGNTPTLRLEQDGSSGFTPQTWDVAGNEANFFVRDATNGSTLPFRIIPGAPSNAIYVASDGDVGLGTSSPASVFHVSRTGIVVPLFESSDNDAVQIRVKTNSTNRRLVALDGSNNVESQIVLGDNGDFEFLGPTASDVRASLDSSGNMTVQGTLVTDGGGACDPGPCDGTFTDYELESIEEHAAYMWENKHLWGVGPTPEGAPINLPQKTTGILHELEKAHIYIEQLHSAIQKLESRLEKLEGSGE